MISKLYIFNHVVHVGLHLLMYDSLKKLMLYFKNQIGTCKCIGPKIDVADCL